MRGTLTRGGAAVLLLGSLVLSGCTEHVKERCSGSGGEMSCTITYKTSDGQWGTDLEGKRYDSTLTLNGTFTVESGSGTLRIQGDDETYEYPLSAEEPVVIEDLTLTMIRRGDDETLVGLATLADPQLDGFSAQYTYVRE